MRILTAGVIAMAIIVVASNILVQYTLGAFLTWGAFTYPFAFLVNELTNRFYGAPAARKVVVAGFITGIICSLIGSQIQGEFGPLVSFRVALGSGAAFLASQLMDVTIFDRMRRDAWWKPPLISPIVSSVLDTGLFFSIAFAAQLSFLDPANDVAWANEAIPLLGVGPVLPLWISLASADYLVKLLIAFVALMPFRLFIRRKLTRVA